MKLKIVRTKTGNDILNLSITGGMNVYSAGKLKDVLLKELKSCSGITLDLAGIDEADTSGFQLLLFLKREARILGKSFRITEMSSRLRNIFNLYKEIV
jgi:anti-anti-sigma factor